jgi:hypothetical protein
MKIALVHNHYRPDHLETVKAEMVIRGAPVIHAVWMECYSLYAALEGCHRLRAARELGLTPEIIEVQYSDDMASTVIGYDGGEDYPIGELCDDSYRRVIINFD